LKKISEATGNRLQQTPTAKEPKFPRRNGKPGLLLTAGSWKGLHRFILLTLLSFGDLMMKDDACPVHGVYL
jgi:hypothetical protein